jgi:hypothetical protein
LDGSLGYKAYQKPPHTNLYLNRGSLYHPSNKQAILAMLVHRLCVTRRASVVSWSSLRPLSRKTGTVVSRYNMALTLR